MTKIVPEKRSSPLKNPLQEKADINGFYHCKYCQWLTKSVMSYRVHLSKFHEKVLVDEGERVGERGDSMVERNNRWLLAHGYVKCPWWTVPCPTKVNPLMARVCKHMNNCPV